MARIEVIKKIDCYIKEKTEILFRLKNHPNYFIKGIFIGYEPNYDYDLSDNSNIIGGIVKVKLPNGENYFASLDEIDSETICPASYNPIFFFPREHISEELRKKVFEKSDYKCVLKLDGCSGKAEECDHIIPIIHGGLTTLENLQPVCKNCNLKKADNFPF